MFDHTLLSVSSLAIGGLVMAGCLATTGQVAASERTELIPRDVFFGNPDRASLRISPDGEHLAYLAPRDGVLNVWVQTRGRDDARAITRATERPIQSFFWAANSEQIIYSIDTGGDENFRLYAVPLDGGDEVALTPFDNVQARVVSTDRNYPDEILAAVNNRVPQLHDVIRINTRTGEREGVFLNNEGYIGFVADSDFNIRVAMRFNPDGGTEAFHRPSDDAEWSLFASWDMEDAASSSPVGWTRDGQTLYMIDSSRANTSGLYAGRFDDEGEFSTELIARHPRADVSDAVIDPTTGRVQAVSFEYARTEWQIIDSSIESDWRTLRAVTDGDFDIISRSRDDRHWLVAYVVDDGPVRYYHYDREAGEVDFLFTNRTALEGKPLASMKPVVIEARDGLKLVSYLTLPRHADEADDPLPMVLLVHGGPWARDSWGYSPMHQWLANRGYAVLSVNFRGSTGFGKDFLNAGNREWAGKMHDDLIDAVDWAVSEGVADRDRVAIMGGSYGGYAALVGMTFTPEVFAAGVSIVGPSHVGTLLESIPPYWEPVKAMFESRVGSLDEEEYLDSISPLTKVDEIRRPLLIGQGANDPRVKESESEQIVNAMQKREIPVTYVLFPDEGHGFARPVNRMAFYAVTEAFLAEHLGGQYEPITHEIGESSAKVPEGARLVPGLSTAVQGQ